MVSGQQSLFDLFFTQHTLLNGNCIQNDKFVQVQCVPDESSLGSDIIQIPNQKPSPSPSHPLCYIGGHPKEVLVVEKGIPENDLNFEDSVDTFCSH